MVPKIYGISALCGVALISGAAPAGRSPLHPDTLKVAPHAPVPDDFDDFNLDDMPEFLRILEEDIPGTDADLWLDTAVVHRNSRPGALRYSDLTEQDYIEVAGELNVDVAAIKAVVDIEAGAAHRGFWAEGKPLINFDLAMFRNIAPRHGVSLKQARKQAPVIFAQPDVRRYGSYQAAQQARLDAAVAINAEAAYKSTFWGMFQIGGFNWKKCGVASLEEFVALMSRSERDQLELFAEFITNGNMVDHIRKHQWLRFATIYNGPKAKSRGYHKRMAAAYARYSKQR